MSTPLEFSMKKPNTQTGINNKSKRMLVSVWSSFAIQFGEKLKVESGLGYSFVLSQVLLTQIWLKSDSNSQNHDSKQKAS